MGVVWMNLKMKKPISKNSLELSGDHGDLVPLIEIGGLSSVSGSHSHIQEFERKARITL